MISEDLFDRCERAAKTVYKNNNWVCIKNRLPERNDSYIIWVGGCVMIVADFIDGSFYINDPISKKRIEVFPTHWKDLEESSKDLPNAVYI